MRKCFTINCNRKIEDFNGYRELISNNIYQGIEIFYPYNVTLEQANFYTEQLNKLRKDFPDLEFVMHLPHGHKNSITFENDEAMGNMFAAIDYSAKYNIKKLTLHLGSVDKNINRSEYLKEDSFLIKNLTALCDKANEYNMNVMIENMPADGEFGYSPDEILETIKLINKDNLKVIIDTGHANVSCYKLIDYVYNLKDYLFHLHYNDNDGSCDQHRKMGVGNINFYEFLDALKNIGYQQLHCMEVIFKEYTELIEFAKDLDKYNRCKDE